MSAAVPYHARGAYDVIKRHLVQRIFKEIFIYLLTNTGTLQTFLPAKFHNFTVSGLFFIHKNKRVQFFMKHGVEIAAQGVGQCEVSATRVVVDAALRRIGRSRHGGHKIANISRDCELI